MDNKKTWMAVGGGIAAVALAYLIYAATSKNKRSYDDSSDDDAEGALEAEIEEAIEGLLPIEREDDSNFLKFDYFLKIFEISQMYARRVYHEDKAEKLVERRKALGDGDIKKYEEIVIEIVQAEENLTNEKLVDILDRLAIDQHEFQANTMHHS